MTINTYLNNNSDLNDNNSDLNDNIYQKILNNEFQNQTLTSEQILEVYKKMKDKYLTQDYNGQSQVISTENVIYQISTFEFQWIKLISLLSISVPN